MEIAQQQLLVILLVLFGIAWIYSGTKHGKARQKRHERKYKRDQKLIKKKQKDEGVPFHKAIFPILALIGAIGLFLYGLGSLMAAFPLFFIFIGLMIYLGTRKF